MAASQKCYVKYDAIRLNGIKLTLPQHLPKYDCGVDRE